jgi:hypothetical protein
MELQLPTGGYRMKLFAMPGASRGCACWVTDMDADETPDQPGKECELQK